MQRDNLEFLEGVDSEYFEYVAETYVQDLEGDDANRASIAMRSAYSHAMETFFALVCAAIQAPGCPEGWLLKYWPRDVRSILTKLSRGETVMTKLSLPELSWQGVSLAIHRSFRLADSERAAQVKLAFGRFWSRLASDYLDEHINDEYNSIKHGIRAKGGGFKLAFGREPQYGVAPPSDQMKTIAASDHGSSYPFASPIGSSKTNFRVQHRSRNWSPQDLGKGIFLIANSIRNVVGCLRIMNGVDPRDVRFSWPENLDEFHRPWKTPQGATNVSFSISFPAESSIPVLDPPAIRASYDVVGPDGTGQWPTDIPRSPGWHVALSPPPQVQATPMSIIGPPAVAKLSVAMAEGGPLEVSGFLRGRDLQRWEEARLVPDVLEWKPNPPACPGWYVTRDVGDQSLDSLERWTVWRDEKGDLKFTVADGGPQLQQSELRNDAEWAYVVGRLLESPTPSPSDSSQSSTGRSDDV